MTDMHREAFEKWAISEGMSVKMCRMPQSYLCGSYEQINTHVRWEGWQAAMRYRDEQEQTSVWRCYKEYMSGDGGRVHSEKFAKTKADMLIFKSQGYDCEKLCDEQEKQA